MSHRPVRISSDPLQASFGWDGIMFGQRRSLERIISNLTSNWCAIQSDFHVLRPAGLGLVVHRPPARYSRNSRIMPRQTFNCLIGVYFILYLPVAPNFSSIEMCRLLSNV
ncbi:hypothetical protein TNCT_115521 [Trichonephila clavata]|uniref:Uncharacterized protein n=1 Tax=Trichonephila clavata TaxID=2740835 RepID=A0A8X6KF68_TRICU|nr:hypothetical protein TNCT_115521 [Trichonephila clavata]